MYFLWNYQQILRNNYIFTIFQHESIFKVCLKKFLGVFLGAWLSLLNESWDYNERILKNFEKFHSGECRI